ncbi:hypothetical protein [Ammoniphilus sp. 3BR4]|uniref:hypothetical protein n=1 Tax=Ammoniphilus sp. 3BR4 TaxID=3158265 RepID=UPI00346686EA
MLTVSKEMFCYICKETREFEADGPRYDWTDRGMVEIWDYYCSACKRNVRTTRVVKVIG